jgi:hypothetical protein
MSVMAIFHQLSWLHAQRRQDRLLNRVCVSQPYHALRPALPSMSIRAATATGHFEMYCDGV